MLDQTMFHEVPDVVHNAVLSALSSLDTADTLNMHDMIDPQEQDTCNLPSNLDALNSQEVYEQGRTMDHAVHEMKRSRYPMFRQTDSGKNHPWSRMPRQAGLVCAGVLILVGAIIYGTHLYKQHTTRKVLAEYYAAAQAGEVTSFSRSYTVNEAERYAELKSRLEEYGIDTESQSVSGISLQLGNGTSDGYDLDGIVLDTSNKVLYLPDRELTDQELMDIIDFSERIDYRVSIKEGDAVTYSYGGNDEDGSKMDRKDRMDLEKPTQEVDEVLDNEMILDNAMNSSGRAAGWVWQKRMQDMSEEEIDMVYLAMFTGTGDVRYSRPFSEYEKETYANLTKCYEYYDEYWIYEWLSENMDIRIYDRIADVPQIYGQISDAPYGMSSDREIDGIAICAENRTFYLPERQMTDEEILQLIDFEHKAAYSIQRITMEVQTGVRTGYPRATEEYNK